MLKNWHVFNYGGDFLFDGGVSVDLLTFGKCELEGGDEEEEEVDLFFFWFEFDLLEVVIDVGVELWVLGELVFLLDKEKDIG